tara:strand:- start:46 stop:279 length:234 start_codon:yes stop_codon:yes gene_type:complete
MNFPRQYHVAVYLVLRWLYPQGGMRGRFWFGPYRGLKKYPLAGNMPGFLSSWLITKKVYHAGFIRPGLSCIHVKETN